MRRVAVIILCGTFALAGCGDRGPDRSTSASGRGRPTIQIVQPRQGATVHGGPRKQITVSVKVSKFKLVDASGKKVKKAKDGEGHVVYYRVESPNAKLPVEPGKSAIKGGQGIFTAAPTASTEYTWVNTPGPHTPPGGYVFAVQLVNNDDTPLSPPQIAFVAVNVQP